MILFIVEHDKQDWILPQFDELLPVETLKKKRKTGISYKAWREAVFNRDDFTCRNCGRKFERHELEAHHIYTYKTNPKMATDIHNGVTLCIECHKLTDSYGRG